MRIGISTSVIQRGRTGIAQHVFALIHSLRRYADEHQFFLFTLEEDGTMFKFASQEMTLMRVGEARRPPVKNILWHQRELPKLASELKLDVLHTPSYRRMIWRSPCPRVATIHDLAPFHVRAKYDMARMFYGRVVARALARRQEEIIAVSENTARDIEEFFKISRSQVTVIHNGIDHARFSETSNGEGRNALAGRFQLPGKFFLYVARLEHPGKNHLRLIEAFERFKHETASDWSLVLGGSDWSGSETIHDAIRASTVRDQIHSLGFVSDKDLPDLYRAADAFIYPSLFEGFGMPPLEAMASGCPVIASQRGALAEVIGDAAAMVDPESVDNICHQMKRVAEEPELREKLRRRGREQSRKFNWERNAAATMEVYRRAAAARRK